MAGSRISVIRLSLTGALSILTLYAVCWVATANHMFLSLFTVNEVMSPTSLCVGALWAFIWGGFAGAVIAIFYNLTGLARWLGGS